MAFPLVLDGVYVGHLFCFVALTVISVEIIGSVVFMLHLRSLFHRLLC